MSTYRLYHFKFWVSPSQTAVTSSPRMSGRPFIHPTSIHCTYVLSNARVLLQAATETKKKQLTSLKTHFSWFGLPYRRTTLITPRNTSVSYCRHVCRPLVDILNRKCDNSQNRY